ncbi:uncharacterized protein N7511_006213 [Penicillium nucicola]|uniref:uncharacterized protein n=1 Tax=Penicillium nucicola TaxID=1850975 RepID=UPI002544E26D|nr:uncharacterized protein N7511_006213 [Penicillium nucicola]KAJ5757519.1 hypothetical protein N7511_006213 [Penicillium nucicola]
MSVTAFTCLPDPRPSRLRRIGQLRNYTQNRSLSSRVPWRSSTSGPNSPNPVENVNESSTPCPDTDHPALSRYISAPSESSAFGDLTSRVSSADSALSTPIIEDSPTTAHAMARLRSASAAQQPPPRTQDRQNSESSVSPEPNSLPTDEIAPTSAPDDSITSPKPDKKATIRFFPYQDAQASTTARPSLPFVPITRTLPSESCVIRVGRYSERDGVPVPNPTEPSDAPVGFKSKVVSRKHCEFLYVNGQWHLKDVGSSSGTFLNHMRLSQPNMVSRLYSIKDGDIVQLGIDFRGGEEMIFRCVRIRIECNRSWQQQPNEFNKNTESLIKNLGKGETADYSGCRECSICLGSVLRPYQCLFMAACAHVWHYKCISRLLHSPDYPMFQCPNCRAFTDLSAEVDDSNDVEERREKESIASAPPAEAASAEEPPVGPTEHIQPEAPSETPNIGPTNDPEPVQEQLGDVTEEESLAGDIPESGLPNGSEQPSLPHQSEQAGLSNRAGDPSFSNGTGGMFIHNDGLGSFIEEDSLSSGLEHLLIQDYLRIDNTSPALGSSTDLARSATISIPGWQPSQPLSIPQGRQAQLRSDTPGRSETSDDNPLTPRNDSGPLAFDGRAGMP